MLSPTLSPLFVLLATCAAPVARAQAAECQVPSRAPSFFKPGVKWQIEIQEPIRVPGNNVPVIPTDAKVWDIDMFQAIKYNVIPELRDQAANEDIFVICYFNAGGLDRIADCDAAKFHDEDILGKIPDWDENYVDIMSSNVIALMQQRIKDGIAAGCDGFDPDNIDGYNFPNLVRRKVDGHVLNATDYYDYVKALADYAHARDKLMGQKNAPQLLDLPGNRGLLKDDIVDFAVTEECAVADSDDDARCEVMQPFINDCKPVFQIEYPSEWNHQTCAATALDEGARSTYCDPWAARNFSTILKLNGDNCGLNNVTQYCDPNGIVITPTDPDFDTGCSN
ncbi:carbohydrate-binding module family 1 protein [Apiospora marii]|uniref:alpha-galactosidase n=1 Tax=Apiospora marii TaxID=335849 RepID=A0ABR1R1Z7_9PEZI